MTLPVSYTDKQLRETLNVQNLSNSRFYYSYASKLSNTGLFSNQRMLILDQTMGQLYYTDTAKAPFKIRERVPIPKKDKDIVNINTSLITQSANDLKIQFSKKEGQKFVSTAWQFTLANKQLANEWFQAIKAIKDARLHKAIGIGDSEVRQNMSFIHQTINFGMLPQEKEKPRESVQPNVNTNERPNNEAANLNINSRISNTGDNVINVSKVTYNNNQASNIRTSRVDPNNPSDIPISEHSRVNPNESNVTYPNKNLSRSILERSRMSQNPKANETDWNIRFLDHPHEQTIYQFQQIAVKAFFTVYEKQKENTVDQVRYYDSLGLFIIIADNFSSVSYRIKMEFRNYHFITEATKSRFIVGVPLCCLIQFQGLVALVKAPIPQRAPTVVQTVEALSQIRQLQKYTRIKNQILTRPKNCKIYDLSGIYSDSKNIILYIDELNEYLPLYSEEELNCALRPEFILDNVNSIISGGATASNPQRNLGQIVKKADNLVKSIALYLSNQEFLFANILELKNFLHINGLNLKYLPAIYKQVSNKAVKKYIHTCMVAKTVKDKVVDMLLQVSKESRVKKPLSAIVEEVIKQFVEGNTNTSTERWKGLALQFKKQYKTTINSHDIVPGFFLNSLTCLIKAHYDFSKVDQQKVPFKDDNIIESGFVVKLLPKVKSYWRFTSKINQELNLLTKSQNTNRETFNEVVNLLKLRQKSVPVQLSLNETDRRVAQFLTSFIKPSGMDSSNQGFDHLKKFLYERVNEEPPTQFSISVTKMYLQYAIQSGKDAQFKKEIELALRIVDYWLDQYHPYHCDFYECLSEYHASIGNIEDSIKFSKQVITTANKSGLRSPRTLGNKYYHLAEKELRGGHKIDALQNFTKAKSYMEEQQNRGELYPLVLMNLALLYLNSGQIDKCIEFATQAQKNFAIQKQKDWDRESIKTYEILGRAYEISLMKNQLREMSVRCAHKFNRCKNSVIFEQMIRISSTGAVGKLSVERGRVLLKCLQKVRDVSSGQYAESMKDSDKAIEYLLKQAQTYIVMERFIGRIDSVERVWVQLNSKRTMSNQSRQFLNLLGHVSSAIGDEFIAGLVQQKEYQ